MSWARLARPVACSFCGCLIAAGVPVRRATAERLAGYRWCAACAKARLDEEPPADLPDPVAVHVPTAVPRAAATFTTFDRKATGTALRTNILKWRRDGRMEAVGEQGR